MIKASENKAVSGDALRGCRRTVPAPSDRVQCKRLLGKCRGQRKKLAISQHGNGRATTHTS